MGITGQRFEIVGGPDAGGARLADHSLHERSKFVCGDGVEAGGGLIEEQERRLKHQDTGERYTSLLAKTQRVTRSVQQVVRYANGDVALPLHRRYRRYRRYLRYRTVGRYRRYLGTVGTYLRYGMVQLASN